MESRRPERLTCAWCGGFFAVRARGRLPKWCSGQCRHRAWEQDRAAKSGRSAVEVVDREVVVTEAVRAIPTSAEWPDTLRVLAQQLDEFKVYRRDLEAVRSALDSVSRALQRRPW
jgi:hypothetical protein